MVERGIYFIDIAKPSAAPPATINFFDFATRRVTPVAALEKEPVAGDSGFAVSPDGRLILYAQRDLTGSDIMLMENFR